MIRLIHCADLHLSASQENRDYSLSVLDEIISIAGREKARYLLFAGDTFDTFGDAESLRAEFRARIQSIDPSCEAVLLAGNHEDLGRGKRRLADFDFGIGAGNIIEFDGTPFRLLVREGLEILAIPHQQDYRHYTEWKVPAKGEDVRLALAHGIVAGMSYSGEQEETGGSVMDADMFHRHGVDYAAHGHIHSRRSAVFGSLTAGYPGSARVWRKNETGPRCVSLLEAGKEVKSSYITLSSAGEYRSLEIFIGFDGEIPPLPEEASSWGSADYIFLEFSGIVENESAARGAIERLLADTKKKVRRLEHEERIEVLAGISAQPLARKFLEAWKRAKPDGGEEEMRVWKRARELGLWKLKETLEARR